MAPTLGRTEPTCMHLTPPVHHYGPYRMTVRRLLPQMEESLVLQESPTTKTATQQASSQSCPHFLGKVPTYSEASISLIHQMLQSRRLLQLFPAEISQATRITSYKIV